MVPWTSFATALSERVPLCFLLRHLNRRWNVIPLAACVGRMKKWVGENGCRGAVECLSLRGDKNKKTSLSRGST